jgi:3-dehydroquinate synthetase
MSTVQVLLNDRSYAIRVVPDALDQLGALLRKENGTERAVVITTRIVAAHHAPKLESALRGAGIDVEWIELADGERAKTLATAGRIYDQLAALDVDRATPIVAFGGGALCDLAGFVASTYLRGLPVVRVPTTLRAQVDGSVGGRTALNHGSGRNRIGTFYPPLLVWIDPQLLGTLPLRELRAGIVELVRVAAIWDAEFFAWLENRSASLAARDLDSLCDAIKRALEIRAEIVGFDERQGGLRALLQFGERFAERVRERHRVLRDGEAAAMGMVFAARLSHARGWLAESDAKRLESLLERLELPLEPPDWSEQRLAYLRALSVDKKRRRPLPAWVLLREIGRADATEVSAQELLPETT